MTQSNIEQTFQQACAAHEKQQYAQAIDYYKIVIANDGQHIAALQNLACIYLNQKDYANAIHYYQHAIKINPNDFMALSNLGSAFQAQHQYQKAIDYFQRALKIQPHSKIYTNIGHNYRQRGDCESAIEHYNKALLLEPDNAQAHTNKALASISLSRFEHAWDEYEWRWEINQHQCKKRLFSQPVWLNEPLNGKCIFLWQEQGLGDEIMFAQFFPKLIKQAKKVYLQCSPRLKTLYQRSFPDITIITDIEQSNDLTFDYHCAIGSLARWFMPTIAQAKPSLPYIKADPSKTIALRNKYKNHSEKLVIGICWHGGRNDETALIRSVDLAFWLPILLLPDIIFVSLQHGDHQQDIDLINENNGVNLIYDKAINSLHDIDDFAAQVAAMDLIISVDNSTVHLAGALGKSVWLMLSYSADWRWLLDRDTSIWYQNVTLLRQKSMGDWLIVFPQIIHSLMALSPNLNRNNYTTCLQHLAKKLHTVDKKILVAKHIHRCILSWDENNIISLDGLASTLKEQNNIEDAILYLEKAVEINPHHQGLQNNLGNAYLTNKQIEPAIACFEKSIRIKPDHKTAYNNLGLAHLEKNQLQTAIKQFKQAIEIDPTMNEAYLNSAVAYNFNLDIDKSIEYLKKAIVLKPNDAKAHWNLAINYLLIGNFDQGWDEFEWRWQANKALKERHYECALPWHGESLTNKRLLVYPEQGYGDTIQFIRLTEQLKQQGAHIIVECYDQLIPVFETLEYIDELIPLGRKYDSFDYYTPIMSLPKLLKLNPNNMPKQTPYIKINPNYEKKWQSIFQAYKKFNIGIVYQGSENHSYDRYRSISSAFFEAIQNDDRFDLFNMQRLQAEKQSNAEHSMIDVGQHIENFADTAALISQLDLLISVDTAPIHIAGALNKKSWLLLPYFPDWRWQLQRNDSPWYPSLRLFRQQYFNDWDSVLPELRQALNDLL